MQTQEQIQEYQKVYQKAYRLRRKKYLKTQKKKAAKAKRKIREHKTFDLDIMLQEYVKGFDKKIPNPFGTFEKAKYIVCRPDVTQPIYFFTTTCRDTEECIKIMKGEFLRRCGGLIKKPKYCCIYKIQHGIEELIFRDVVW